MPGTTRRAHRFCMSKSTTIKVLEPEPEEEDLTPQPLPGPVTYELFLNRAIELPGNNKIKQNAKVGEVVCDVGLSPNWVCRNYGKIIYSKKKHESQEAIEPPQEDDE